jgi:hypothetical protein
MWEIYIETKVQATDAQAKRDDWGFVCVTEATVVNATYHAIISVLVIKPWSQLSYAYDEKKALYITIGESSPMVMPIETHQDDGQPPSRFALRCDSADVAYSEPTGLADLFGYRLLFLDTKSGALHLRPELGMQANWLDQEARTRWTFPFTCTIFGFYDQWRAGGVGTPLVQHAIKIELRDNTCWSKYISRPVRYGNVEQVNEELNCRKKCAADPACVSYEHWETQCTLMGAGKKGVYRMFKGTIIGFKKIPKCGERSTCLRVTVNGSKYLSGRYCFNAEGTEPAYIKIGPTPLEHMWLRAPGQYGNNRCSTGEWAIQRHLVAKRLFLCPSS